MEINWIYKLEINWITYEYRRKGERGRARERERERIEREGERWRERGRENREGGREKENALCWCILFILFLLYSFL